MISFQVNDMTCGRCLSSITRAVKAADPGAQVRVDLAARRVAIEPVGANAADLSDAIRDAGFTPLAIEHAARPGVAAAVPGGQACCCG